MDGSGFGRTAARDRCEDLFALDVRRWQREGRLEPGYIFHCGEGDMGAEGIKVAVEETSLVLIHRNRSTGEEISQRFRLDWTACQYGGHRPWFICSHVHDGKECERRVAKLYFKDGNFACRICHGLTYASQQKDPWGQALATAQAIRMKLGGDAALVSPFPDKPARMHWSTYRRLRERGQRAEAQVWERAQRLTGR